MCGSNFRCLKTNARERLLPLLEGDWNSGLRFSTASPLQLSEYEAQIERMNVAFTHEIYSEAKNEVTVIQSELTDAFLSTEIVAGTMLNAKRIIQSVDNGQNAISVGSVSVVKSALNLPIILVLSVLFGGMIGVFFYPRSKCLKEACVAFG